MSVTTKGRPILFSGPMVLAILAGRKTQTRRVVKPQHPDATPGDVNGHPCLVCPIRHKFGATTTAFPRHRPGDRLWVRETWGRYRECGRDTEPDAPVIYRADADGCGQYPCEIDGRVVRVTDREPWKSSIHMPRWASRITLEVTEVRVERIQDITEEGAVAEGFPAREQFATTWDALNARRGFPWDGNPWAWVVSFERVGAVESPAGIGKGEGNRNGS